MIWYKLTEFGIASKPKLCNYHKGWYDNLAEQKISILYPLLERHDKYNCSLVGEMFFDRFMTF